MGHHVACAGVLVWLACLFVLHERHQLHALSTHDVPVLIVSLDLDLLNLPPHLVRLTVLGLKLSLSGICRSTPALFKLPIYQFTLIDNNK